MSDPTSATAIAAAFLAILRSDFDATLERLRDHRGKIVLNADDLFRQYPPYETDFAARKTLGPLLYEAASQFRDEAFHRLLAAPPGRDDTVIFTAGGGASGKSTSLRARARISQARVNFIVDTTFSSWLRAKRLVDDALAAGRKVEINYVFRPFEDCVLGMLERALDPAVGRVVPIDDMARTHAGSQETIILADAKYFFEPRVAILLWKNTGRNEVEPMSISSLQRRRHPPVDDLRKRGQAVLDEVRQGHNARWQGEPISQSLYEAARSQTQSAKKSPNVRPTD